MTQALRALADLSVRNAREMWADAAGARAVLSAAAAAGQPEWHRVFAQRALAACPLDERTHTGCPFWVEKIPMAY